MMRLGLAALLVALAAPVASAQIGAPPTGRCAFEISFDRQLALKLPSGQYNNYFAGNIVARCPSQRLTLKSDSLEVYGDEGRYFFIGNVEYTEPRLALRSEQLTYFQRDERLLAVTNVDAKLPSGSTLTGPTLEFWREIPGVRQQHATAPSRPTISIIERDSAGTPQPPVTVTGNTVWLVGDSTVASSGQVVVLRPELNASGDSLWLDGGTGLLRMMRNPRVLGRRGRPFTLVGETIDVLSKQRRLDRVLSKSKAEATSQDLNLKSDTIDLRFVSDSLSRAIAWGRSRARAVSAAQSIVSDSIDVLMPSQRLREMHAVGGAIAEANPDTVRFRTTERDRLTGDTIVAHFDTTASLVRDTTSKPRLRLLVSNGNATSLQHMPPRDSTLRIPAVVYVAGRGIDVTFDSGAVKRVEVRDDSLARGLYLEPERPDSARRRASTTAAAGAPPTRPPVATTPAGGTPAPAPAPTSPTSSPTPAVVPRRP